MMIQPKIKSPVEKKAFTGLAGTILVAVLAFFLWVNYDSQMRLREKAISRLVENLGRQASSVGYFCGERRSDLKNLARAREISIFFQNRALGMSMAYGLRASLVQIRNHLNSLTLERKIGKEPVYQRMMFFDVEQGLLVDNTTIFQRKTDRFWKEKPAFSKMLKPVIQIRRNSRDMEMVATAPVFFKKELKGWVMAWIDMEAVFKHLLYNGNQGTISRRIRGKEQHVFIDFGSGVTDSFYPETRELPVGLIRNQPQGKPVMFSRCSKTGVIEPCAVVKTEVPDTLFHLVTVRPVDTIPGYTRPFHLFFVMIILAFFAVAAFALLWTMHTREMVLKTRLEEEHLGKRKMEATNLQLKETEAELEQHRAHLELLVKERTEELEKAQNELVNKAVDAGRAQLSAMVLHNIGNAVTPVVVNVETLKNTDLIKIHHYLDHCVKELDNHKSRLTDYVMTDQRGIQVFAYLKELVSNLGRQLNSRASLVDSISVGMDHMAEILSLQGVYAPEREEGKEKVDLNLLVEDALKIQASSLAKQKIDIKKDYVPEPLPLIIEKTKLMQVVINFIKNSCDAMDEKKGSGSELLEVTTYREGNRIGLTMRDTGCGVTAEKLPRVFEFGESSKGPSGYGLFYCKSFVEANQGTLTLESPGAGRGATITMEFYKSSQTPPHSGNRPH